MLNCLKHLKSSKFRPFSHLDNYVLLKPKLKELSDSRKYNHQKLLSELLCFENVLLCCKLIFKFVLIPKIKVSTDNRLHYFKIKS